MIKLINVNKYYQSGNEKIHAVRDFSVTFPEKGLVFILGPSGSGKSTLLNLLGGLDKPDEGEIWVENYNLALLSKKEKNDYLNSYLGFVFQEYNILKDLTLKENISLPLEIQNIKAKKRKELLNKVIEDVELTGLENRKVSQLSGGQKQRIAIARAVVKNPNLIIADEPTGNLDSETSTTIFELFKKLAKERLIIIVTHDEESALLYNDMLIRISPDGNTSCESQTMKTTENVEVLK
ncbi:MAG: ABC transporter ATP-binding protein [Bacilli bacterium]|nr:ABC transporter ATP-binding protein [Bacilli bacterium]